MVVLLVAVADRDLHDIAIPVPLDVVSVEVEEV